MTYDCPKVRDDLKILNLYFEPEEYARILKIIGGKAHYEDYAKQDAILLSTKDNAARIRSITRMPFSQLKLAPEASE